MVKEEDEEGLRFGMVGSRGVIEPSTLSCLKSSMVKQWTFPLSKKITKRNLSPLF